MSSTALSGRRASVVLTVLATLVAGLTLAPASPAKAANRVTPGSFTGYGFDQCITPSQEAMDVWLERSPYWAVGIYIAGDSRHCGDEKQENLTAAWVDTQLRNGWRLLPITVGPQAWCNGRYKDKVRISPDPSDGYATARQQGRAEARETVRRARKLGIAARSTLWYDIEAYSIGRRRCRESVLSFLSAWTRTLHKLRYVSGVYSSAASGIKAIDDARALEPGRFRMPDRVWIAEWVAAGKYRQPPTATPPSLLSAFVRDDGWMPNRRMRQYRGGHDETYGGVTINIDTNYLDLGRGSVAPKARPVCGGTRLSFPRYKRLVLGERDRQVRAAQCLLRRKKLYRGDITGRYNRATQRAVLRFQKDRDLRRTGRIARATWVTMLSEGSNPILKYGSARPAVRRLQRALNAASGAGLAVSGVFDFDTTRAMREYQGARKLARTGVAADPTWLEMESGRF